MLTRVALNTQRMLGVMACNTTSGRGQFLEVCALLSLGIWKWISGHQVCTTGTFTHGAVLPAHKESFEVKSPNRLDSGTTPVKEINHDKKQREISSMWPHCKEKQVSQKSLMKTYFVWLLSPWSWSQLWSNKVQKTVLIALGDKLSGNKYFRFWMWPRLTCNGLRIQGDSKERSITRSAFCAFRPHQGKDLEGRQGIRLHPTFTTSRAQVGVCTV